MQITVIGTSTAWHDPEIGRLTLDVNRSGADAAQVYDETVAAVQHVTADLRRLDEQDALDSWAVHPVTTSSWVPHDPSGRPQPEEHTARAEVSADFRDPEVLAAFVARHGSTPGVAQRPVVWDLSDETRERLRDEATAGAVEDAQRRAEVVARAAGAGALRCLAIADPGLLASSGSRDEPVAFALTGGTDMARAGHESIEPRPGRIEVRVQVHAVFETRVGDES
jgi:uncharacterized protein YggE